jgi:lariat debranching enzyme
MRPSFYICLQFQAVRNAFDLNVMSVPAKFREIGDFHEYYSGTRKAPYLTIFVGGNHEASSHLWELYYGGWVAPNIYYMGAANVVRLGPVRIAGMSGIWKGYNYNKTHHERLPYNQDDIKTIYHVREPDVRKLLQIRTQVDIGISHDWPRAIERYGDEKELFRMKPDFEQESKDGSLGNQAATYVMDRLRPPYWFAAHMHCRFAATRIYREEIGPEETAQASIASTGAADVKIETLPAIESNGTSLVAPAQNADEIDLDMDDDDSLVSTARDGETANDKSHIDFKVGPSTAADVPEDIRAQLPAAFSKSTVPSKRLAPGQPSPPTITNKTVRFLALDKCLPGRKFLQLLEILPSSTSQPSPLFSEPRYHLEYDPEWLAITRVFAPMLVLGDRNAKPSPNLGEEHYRSLIETEEAWVYEHIIKSGKLTIPENFTVTAPVHLIGMPESQHFDPQEYNNPQMEAFCELLGIENKFFATVEEKAARMAAGPAPAEPRRDGGFGGGGGRGRGHSGRGGGRGRGRGGNRGRGFGRGRGPSW